MNGNSKTGFINNDRIITLIGHEVDCKINSDIIFFSLNSFQRIGNKIIKKSLQQYNMIAANLIKGDTRRINTHHPEPILTSYDELKAIFELIVHNEGSKTFYVDPLPDDLSLGTAEKWITGIKKSIFIIFLVFWKLYLFDFTNHIYNYFDFNYFISLFSYTMLWNRKSYETAS